MYRIFLFDFEINLKMGQMVDQPMATRRSPGPNQVVRGLKGDLKNIP